MQAVFGSRKKFPFYVLGFLALLGILLGRFVCGWLCLFGLIQELLYKIPVPKLKVPKKLDSGLRWLKYVLLILFVIVLPAFLKVNQGLSSVPYFCKYICPVGTLEGGIPLAALDAGIRSQVNHLGDIDVYAGEIYAGAENFSDGAATDIQIAVYDAETLI